MQPFSATQDSSQDCAAMKNSGKFHLWNCWLIQKVQLGSCVCACRRKEEDIEKWKGIRIFAERYWCHDYTTLYWRHVSCLRPLFCLDMWHGTAKAHQGPLHRLHLRLVLPRLTPLQRNYTNSPIKLNNRFMELANYLKCQDCTSRIWDTENIWFRKTKALKSRLGSPHLHLLGLPSL